MHSHNNSNTNDNSWYYYIIVFSEPSKINVEKAMGLLRLDSESQFCPLSCSAHITWFNFPIDIIFCYDVFI